jgi:hypothetical protein
VRFEIFTGAQSLLRIRASLRRCHAGFGNPLDLPQCVFVGVALSYQLTFNPMPPDPQKREPLYLLDKKTVAKAQLQTAILLWFNEGDPASILALAVNANDCYNTLGGHLKGKPSVFQTWLADQSETYQKRARRAQNFIKHGWKNLTEGVPYSPRMAEILILDSIECHENIEGRITSLMQVFDLRYALENPDRVRASGLAVLSRDVAKVENLRRQDRRLFFKESRDGLVRAGLWNV